MPTKDDMRWFKQQFHEKINAALVGSPYSLDFMTALACQETGEIWPTLRTKDLSVDRILELCVGDTIDFHPSTGKGRKAFPRNKAALLAAPNGQQMFDIARQGLVDMAQFIHSYQDAASNPDKFCHGYGIFQFDLQFFITGEADYFLQKRFADFDACLKKALGELQHAITKVPGAAGKSQLTDFEMASVAIAYNTGGFHPSMGLKQGFRGKDKHGQPAGLFYGEQVFAFIEQSKTVTVDDASPVPPNVPAAPTPAVATGPSYKVTSTDPLRLRSEAVVDATGDNVKAHLPNGHIVRAITNQPVNDFLEVETDFQGKHFRGFASNKFLEQV